MKNIIKICDKTLHHFKTIIKNTNSSKILIGVNGGGCNGLKYFVKPINNEYKLDKLDEKIKINDLNIVICSQSLMYLLGTEIKWKDDYMGSGLEFTNPNAESTCGCGETFSPKN